MAAEWVDSFADDGWDDDARDGDRLPGDSARDGDDPHGDVPVGDVPDGDGLDDDGRGEGSSGRSRRRVLRPFVSEALGLPTGPEMLAGLVDLTGRDDLSAREWVEVAAGWKAISSFCAAGLLTAVAELDRSFNPAGFDSTASAPGRTCSVRPAADEVAPVLGIAPRAASALVALARRLLADLPGAADALAEGRMDLTQVKILDQVTRDLPTGVTTQVEAAAVRWAPARTAQQLRAALAAEAARVDPEYAVVACARGVGERDVSWRPSPLPGCRRLVADLPMVPGTAAWLALNGAAKTAKKTGIRLDGSVEERSLPQLRADTLTALLTGQTTVTAQGGPAGRVRVPTPGELAALAEVQVVVAADTLTGTGDLPAHLPGTGPVDVATVRDLAGRARWRRLVADPDTGALVHADHTVHPPPRGGRGTGERPAGGPDDTGCGGSGGWPGTSGGPGSGGGAAGSGAGVDPRWARLLTDPVEPEVSDDGTRYRPSARLRRRVHTRDATCIGPACFHPAATAQLDHSINFGERGPGGVMGATVAGNLGSTCERIHNAKTHGGWHLRQPRPGDFVWTSPTGRTYRVQARPLVPSWHRRQEGPTLSRVTMIDKVMVSRRLE